jgi:hypothetical protein
VLTHRRHRPRWARRSRLWWNATPREDIVRMWLLLTVVVLVAGGLVLLVLTRD